MDIASASSGTLGGR